MWIPLRLNWTRSLLLIIKISHHNNELTSQIQKNNDTTSVIDIKILANRSSHKPPHSIHDLSYNSCSFTPPHTHTHAEYDSLARNIYLYTYKERIIRDASTFPVYIVAYTHTNSNAETDNPRGADLPEEAVCVYYVPQALAFVQDVCERADMRASWHPYAHGWICSASVYIRIKDVPRQIFLFLMQGEALLCVTARFNCFSLFFMCVWEIIYRDDCIM